jgi:hypothetical protein
MARYGLGHVDLNLRAQLALRGLTDNPTADIARLLASIQPIEPESRVLLAAALKAKPGPTIHLRATASKHHKALNSFRKRLVRLWMGREGLKLIQSLGYNKAVCALAVEHSVSDKTVIASIALARRLAQRIERMRKTRPDVAHLTDRELEIAYLHGNATRRDPLLSIRPSLPDLAQLIDEYERLLQASAGLHRAWQKDL